MSRQVVVQPTLMPATQTATLRGGILLLLFWLLLRMLLSAWLAVVSVYVPKRAIEHALPLWPPSDPLNLWLERVILLPWLRRDAVYYVSIVQSGYRLDDGSAQFHPLYPWLGSLVSQALGIGALPSLLLVSSICGLALLFAFERLALLDLPPAAARRATVYLFLFPVSFIFFAPYTEALFLLCAVLALYYARQGNWLGAGFVGCLATLTRQQGIVLLLPLIWELWEQGKAEMHQLQAEQAQPPRSRLHLLLQLSALRSLPFLALVPLGLLIFKLYRVIALGELGVDLSSLHGLIYSLMISPSSSKVVPMQAILPPWQALAAAVGSLGQPGSYTTLIDLTLGAVFVLLAALGWRQLRPSYRAYVLGILLLSFAYYTGPHFPYMGLPRHCLLAVPLFLPLAQWGRRVWLNLLLFVFSVFGMLFLALQYGIEGWVP